MGRILRESETFTTQNDPRYIGLPALIKNREACGRPKDLEDLKYLREAAKKTGHKA